MSKKLAPGDCSCVVVVFVGAKFTYPGHFGKVPFYVSLSFITATVAVSILAAPSKTRGAEGPEVVEEKQQRSST